MSGVRRAGVAPRRRRDDDRGVAQRPSAAPILSAIGLAVVALATLSLLTGSLPALPGAADGGGIIANRTPAPSNVVIVDPRSDVPGSIAYAKGGNIWVQSGSEAKQITNGGNDAMPTWSADGAWIYYVETKTTRGLFPYGGPPRYYDLTSPTIVRVRPDGSGREPILSGRYTRSSGKYAWFFWLRQPVPDPAGKRLAVISDGPDPTQSDIVLQLVDVATGKLTNLKLPERAPLGHQDPAWRPTGASLLAYVMNDRDGVRGAPSIWTWDPKTKKRGPLTGPGYMGPAWSPDGRWIAATKQRSVGTDVVILDASTGAEVARVTNDGDSWGAAWSPAGDAISFLHIGGGIADLRMVTLERDGDGFSIGEILDLTQASGLDPASRPSWFIPADQLPDPTPPPTPAPTPAASSAAP